MRTDDPLSFAADLVRALGGVAERAGSGFEALLPPEAARDLGWPEHARLASSVGGGEEDDDDGLRVTVGHGRPELERAVRVALGEGRVASVRARDLPSHKQGVADLAAARFVPRRGARRAGAPRPAERIYLVVDHRVEARSVDRRSATVRLAACERTGVVLPGLPAALDASGTRFEPRPAPPPEPALARRVALSLARAAEAEARTAVAAFVTQLGLRLARDRARIGEYFEDLGREAQAARTDATDGDLLATLTSERDRRRADVDSRYRVDVRVTPVAALRVAVTAVVVPVAFAFRDARRTIDATWNPVTREFDPVACDACAAAVARLDPCRALHLLCGACAPACPACGARICQRCPGHACPSGPAAGPRPR